MSHSLIQLATVTMVKRRPHSTEAPTRETRCHFPRHTAPTPTYPQSNSNTLQPIMIDTYGDAIAAILAPEFANTTCFNSNMHRSNPSSCLLSPGPPWDSATRSTPCSQGDSATAIGRDPESRPIGDSTPIPEEAGFAALRGHATRRLNTRRCSRSHD